MSASGRKAVIAAAARVPQPDSSTERVPWVRPVFEADDALLGEIQRVLSSGRVTNDGPNVCDLERRLARYLEVDGCVAVSSGSMALLLAVRALAFEGAKVVLPAFSYIATLNAVVHAGMSPVFCDVEPGTWTLSPTHLRRLLAADPTIRLILAVNVFGVLPDLAAIQHAIEGSGAVLLLDNAHGFGTDRAGVRSVPEPVAQAFSFHATKVLPAVEGGAVVAADPRLLAEIRRLRNHGLAADLLESMPGYNAKLSEIHAVVGRRSLDHVESALARRRQYAMRLRRVLMEECATTFTVQEIPEGMHSNFQNLAVLCPGGAAPTVAAVQAALERDGIETRRYFWPMLHQLPAYRGHFCLPVTEDVGSRVLCLPLHSHMETAMLTRIEAAVRRVSREWTLRGSEMPVGSSAEGSRP